jgi:phosphoglycerate kinase
MGRLRTLDNVEVGGRRVLVRADLNVPMRAGKPTDLTRIERLAPTIVELRTKGARVVLMSHFGRPKGADPTLSLGPLIRALGDECSMDAPVFAPDCIGAAAAAIVDRLRDGEVALLENLRFHPGEEANDPEFAAALAMLGDLYVGDAFSCAHRSHASVVALPRRMPAAAGRAMQAEIEALERVMEKAERPLMAIVGGAKVSTKLGLLRSLVARVDILAIGGAMANTFLRARGHGIGRSLWEADLAAETGAVETAATAAGCTLVLPKDVSVAHELIPGAPFQTVAATAVPEDALSLDIGPATVRALRRAIERSRTLVWNGPLGAFETPPFDAGTNAAATAAAALTARGRLLSVAGGGDTLAALEHAGVAAGFTYISAAGGAFLEWLEGKELPGVVALTA